jgi:transcriptional regulator with XRE-family HTH domain
MTSTKFRLALQALHWSQRNLAEVLRCSPRLVRMWANAEAPVPAEVAVWLEGLQVAHQTHRPPTGVRRPPGRVSALQGAP